ncbi:hypothetical protein [Bilophila wadsworthia]|uniref:hypothetical protein n=1 Tax=Bilophila wadsworthia TaxID=35833 RepID=UPI00242FF61F|nr:hypothetical protein [Bilophila wadsworthia]
MANKELISFKEMYEESKRIYNMLFVLNGTAIISLVSLMIAYDKNISKGFDWFLGSIYWFIGSILVSFFIIIVLYSYRTYMFPRRHNVFTYKFLNFYFNFIICGMWSSNIILFLNFAYGIACVYSLLKYGVKIL